MRSHRITLSHHRKTRAIGTVVPLVLLSARRDCGRLVYTRALSDARASAYPTAPYLPILLLRLLVLPPIHNTNFTVLSAHSMTTVEFSSTHRFPISRETLQFGSVGGILIPLLVASAVSNHVFVSTLLQTILRHSSEDSQRASTQIQYPHVSPSSTVSSSPSLSPSISINTMTPTVETPSCAYTDIQPTNNFKKDHGDHQEEEHQQPDSAYMAESPYVPCPCPCEPQPQSFNALRMSFVSLHPCMECTRRDP
jgi:hypothetical protein